MHKNNDVAQYENQAALEEAIKRYGGQQITCTEYNHLRRVRRASRPAALGTMRDPPGPVDRSARNRAKSARKARRKNRK